MYKCWIEYLKELIEIVTHSVSQGPQFYPVSQSARAQAHGAYGGGKP